MADFQVGGQAVIEGVMIRSESRIATAVRRADNTIVVKSSDYKPLARRNKIIALPIIRGFIGLFEMLVIGITSLNFSAEIAAQDIDKAEGRAAAETKKSSGLMIALSIIFALGIGILVFFFLPLWVASLLGFGKDALLFNLIAGAIRITLFLGYVTALSYFKDFRRIFEYHGAEHKSIWAYENQDPLTPENAQKYTTLHPRCGTSFILIVALFAILIFAIADTLFQILTGHPPQILVRFAIHFALLPLVAGGSYEILKASARSCKNPLVRALIKPGLWLQLITTKEPSLDQLEVALVAVKASLGLPQDIEVRELADA
ncbi:MAG: DUF1385 domain-containing protein [candidate division Zixibacteria bacterium]|nr:DUF1385 domain-containing protein [candidate division Zixibacteria bacterium]